MHLTQLYYVVVAVIVWGAVPLLNSEPKRLLLLFVNRTYHCTLMKRRETVRQWSRLMELRKGKMMDIYCDSVLV